MFPASFGYVAARSVAEALELMAKHGEDGKLLAGGHSLIPAMKLRLQSPRFLIDLGTVPGLQGIKAEGGQLIIGALTVHADVATSDLVRKHMPGLSDAASVIGDVQVRNRGTIGGSVAHADPAGDVPAAIVALEAEIKITGPNGERWVKCDDFFLGLLMSVLEPDEVVTAVKVPVTGADKTAYLKAAPRSSGFAVVGVAVRLTMDNQSVCSRAAIGITGVTDKAYRPERAEQMLTGKKLDTALIQQAAAEATRNIEVIEDINGSAEYRKHLTEVYVERAIEQALAG
jgi:carbon-monoxide dehydrogenase medium subunit